MKYFYKQSKGKQRNNNNTLIEVFTQRKNGFFVCVGESNHNTGSWRGATGAVCTILSKKYGYKTDGYFIARKDVEIIPLP